MAAGGWGYSLMQSNKTQAKRGLYIKSLLVPVKVGTPRECDFTILLMSRQKENKKDEKRDLKKKDFFWQKGTTQQNRKGGRIKTVVCLRYERARGIQMKKRGW